MERITTLVILCSQSPLNLHQFCLTRDSKYGLVGTYWNAICWYFVSTQLNLALLLILTISEITSRFIEQGWLIHGPLLLDGLLGAEMMNLLKIRNFFKSSFGVNVKVHISHQKKFCKAMFIHFRFIVSQSL